MSVGSNGHKVLGIFYYILLLAVILLGVFNSFYNLGVQPIVSYDEARHGASAYEMLKTKQFIVNTYDYQMDYWNLKPPLSFWLIILGYKWFGFNTFGLRFFSAAAAVCTSLLIAWFVRRHFGLLASLIATLTFVTTSQFMIRHGARLADPDALYVLWFTLAMVAMLSIRHNIKWLYVAGTAFSLAFLTKSLHAGVIEVIIVLYVLFINSRIKTSQLALFALCSILPVLAWGVWRYAQDGFAFFRAMVGFDLIARTTSTLEGHVGGPTFYLENFGKYYFYWLLVLLVVCIGFLALPLDKRKQSQAELLGLGLWAIVPLILYSIPKTKILWYIFPVYPAFAILIGVFAAVLLRVSKSEMLKVMVIILLLGAAVKSEQLIIQEIFYPYQSTRQASVKNLQPLKAYHSTMLYKYDEPDKLWEQNDLLAAELYADLRVRTGGLTAFLQDNTANSLIIVPKVAENLKMATEHRLLKVTESANYWIFAKPS